MNAELATVEVEEQDNEIREDGVACHWLAQEIWEGREHPVGSLAPNGRELTEEMFDAVADYHASLLQRGVKGHWQIEQKLPVSEVFPGVQDGTPDAQLYAANTLTLYTDDLKYGFRPVEVWENLQLLIYGYTRARKIIQAGGIVSHLVFTIHQPRCPHPEGTKRIWQTTMATVEPLVAWLRERAAACYAPEPDCHAGPHCHDCAAAYGCPAFQAAALRAMEVAYRATPATLTVRQLAYELAHMQEAQKLLEGRVAALETQVEFEIRRGNVVPGFELARKGTRKRWMEGQEPNIVQICQMFKVDPYKAPQLRSPSQLRSKLPKGTLDRFEVQPTGELAVKRVGAMDIVKKFLRDP